MKEDYQITDRKDSRTFFYARPVLLAPLRDGFVVTFAGSSLRLPATPAHVTQHVPDTGGIVLHAEAFLNQLHHALQDP